MRAPLLLEVGCEEIPARMIAAAAAELGARIVALLDQAGLPHGAATAWGGSRRVAVRIEDVEARQADREEVVLGPPAAAAFGPDGAPTPAATGFARKQGIDPSALERIETERGAYAGFRRTVVGRPLGVVVDGALQDVLAAMSFPKTMRWGDGRHRWVRPVHWIVALHGGEALDVGAFGVRSGRVSSGHRFLAPGAVEIRHADAYAGALRTAFVVADPAERRARLRDRLEEAARSVGGSLVPDEALLEEIVDLVEWPGIVVGRFDASFLDLPREILVTTLRHHQKSFSVQGGGGLLPAFLAVANTDRDAAGHVRRGNEWVVSGRLDDARFFWSEDRKRALADRLRDLGAVVFHVGVGSYADKASAIEKLAHRIALHLDLDEAARRAACEAARLAKADLVTGIVGEFPELQGVAGGLLLRAEGADPEVATAVYDHYRPLGADDALPTTAIGAVASVADRLHTASALVAAGERPTGSRDPFALRRALTGVFRIVEARRWSVSLGDLVGFGGGGDDFASFLLERFQNYLRDAGFTQNEIAAVTRPRVSADDFRRWSLGEIRSRLEVVRGLRARPDFARLVELTKRVDNILEKEPAAGGDAGRWVEQEPAAIELRRVQDDEGPRILDASREGRFDLVIDRVARYVEPVAAFFDDVLVLDSDNVDATRWRCALLRDVRDTVTRDFDIRELAGQAERRI